MNNYDGLQELNFQEKKKAQTHAYLGDYRKNIIGKEKKKSSESTEK